MISRWVYFQVAAVLAAAMSLNFSVSFAQTGPPKIGWDQLVQAAKKEGKLALLSPAGDVYRQVWDAFQKRYGIQVEVFAASPASALISRVQAERAAGKFLWDVAVYAPTSLYTVFKPRGWLEPIRPSLVLPEVLDSTKWIGGFEDGFLDVEKTYVYGFVKYLNWNADINRNLVPESELSKFDQLWDSKWNGKILMYDPLTGLGDNITAVWLKTGGAEKLRRFFRDQRVNTTQDRRQMAEWVVRGRYPIGVGVVISVLQIFKQQGLDVAHVKSLVDDDPAAARLTYGNGSVALVNGASHLNAAKLFINWLLSKEGQTIFAQRTGYNVRRTDAPVVSPEEAIDPKKIYVDVTIEENYGLRREARKILEQVIKQ
jgi:iron(III) transport system substrate-binding protein